jgi:hypothetical protein
MRETNARSCKEQESSSIREDEKDPSRLHCTVCHGRSVAAPPRYDKEREIGQGCLPTPGTSIGRRSKLSLLLRASHRLPREGECESLQGPSPGSLPGGGER